MAWPSPGSAIFTQAAQNPILGGVSAVTVPTGWTFGTTTPATAAHKVALYGNAGTPDKDAAVASTGYNAGAWVTGNESTGTGYTAGGVVMGTRTWALATGNPATFTLANSVAPTWTLTSAITANGDLVYCTTITGGTVANQGFAMHSFGGAVSLGGSGGTFTIAWPTVNSVANTVFQLSFAYA
jgi:hypothetical protein